MSTAVKISKRRCRDAPTPGVEHPQGHLSKKNISMDTSQESESRATSGNNEQDILNKEEEEKEEENERQGFADPTQSHGADGSPPCMAAGAGKLGAAAMGRGSSKQLEAAGRAAAPPCSSQLFATVSPLEANMWENVEQTNP
ncbi:hypothetical protein UY3_08064 [Chelonia mydas]|uniref:Uncharacterized protein n=1 Tax=Chelonia mydas TaxID=8469 RepID=M7BRQ3_CHEMY|nr:hypothetical protein UY3_08064 [Chelonia mydas]